jgi:tetratricopeptide (TPR) repeat protein
VQKAHPELYGPRQAEWLERLDHERENLLAAHGFCDQAENGAELGLRLVASIKMYWASRGLLRLAHRAMSEALARAPEPNRHRSRVLFDAGQIACFLGRYAEARPHLEECIEIARERDDPERLAAALQPLGMACLGLGERSAARACFEEGLALARGQQDRRNLAAALIALAQLERVEGHAEAAEALYMEGLEMARELGDRETVAIALLNLAMVCIDRGQGDRARLMLSEAMEVAVASRSRPLGQSSLEVCAGLAAWAKEWTVAARWYGAAQAQAEASAIHRDPADAAFLSPWMQQTAAALGDERAAHEAAGRALAFDAAVGAARDWLRGS